MIDQTIGYIREKWKVALITLFAIAILFFIWDRFVPVYLRWGFIGVALMVMLYWWYPDLRKKTLTYGIPASIFFFFSFFSKAFWGLILILWLLFVAFRESQILVKTSFLYRYRLIPLIFLCGIIIWEPIRTHIIPKRVVIEDYGKEDTDGDFKVSNDFPDGSSVTYTIMRFDLIAGLFDGQTLWKKFDGKPIEIWYKGIYIPGLVEPEVFRARHLDEVQCDDIENGYYARFSAQGMFEQYFCADQVSIIEE